MYLYISFENYPEKEHESKLAGLRDYRVYCFNGSPKLIYSYTNISNGGSEKPEPKFCDIYDCGWNPVPFHQKSLPLGNIEKPKALELMLELSQRLSKDIPFVRVDYYYVNGSVYIGELTLYPGSGMSSFTPPEWDRKLGDWLTLPEKVIL